MKIPSWTGNEVEARVGMVCKLQTADIGGHDFAIVTITKVLEHDIELDGNCWFVMDGCGAADLTMLHCPLQIGDEVHIYYITGHDWRETGAFGHRYFYRDTKGKPGRAVDERDGAIRHANPDLRTSPGYQEENRL